MRTRSLHTGSPLPPGNSSCNLLAEKPFGAEAGGRRSRTGRGFMRANSLPSSVRTLTGWMEIDACLASAVHPVWPDSCAGG